MIYSKYQIGKIFEQKAKEILISKGHKIISCNIRLGALEIDIISEFQNITIFWEIRSTRYKAISLDLIQKIFPIKKRQNFTQAIYNYIEKYNIMNISTGLIVFCKENHYIYENIITF